MTPREHSEPYNYWGLDWDLMDICKPFLQHQLQQVFIYIEFAQYISLKTN